MKTPNPIQTPTLAPALALKLLPIGRAHDLTRMEIEGKHVESAGLRTDFPA